MAADAAWNHAPKRLWRRLSVYLRPDIHAEAERHGENFSLFLNNSLARKYDLEPCLEGGVRRATRLRRLEQTTEALEGEIASLSVELADDRLVPGLRQELDLERARVVAARDRRSREEADRAARAGCIASVLDALLGDGPGERYRRMLPENDPHGDSADALDELVALVSRRCGDAVDPAEVVAGLRRRVAAAVETGEAR